MILIGGLERRKMSDYKRLTNNNLEEYNPEYDFCMGCKYFGEPNGCNRPNGTCGNYERFIETYNRLAELEDKIENGTLVELGGYYIKPFAIKKSGLFIIVRIEERGVSGTFEKDKIPEAEKLIRKWRNEDTLS